MQGHWQASYLDEAAELLIALTPSDLWNGTSALATVQTIPSTSVSLALLHNVQPLRIVCSEACLFVVPVNRIYAPIARVASMS